MPEVLSWDGQSGICSSVHRFYVRQLDSLLGAALLDLQNSEPKLSAAVRKEWEALPETKREKLLTAPEMSFRLFEKGADTRGTASFLLRSIEAEQACEGLRSSAPEPGWSALGEFCCGVNGYVRSYPKCRSGLVLDFESPHTQNVEFGGKNDCLPEDRPKFTLEEMEVVAIRVDEACEKLERLDPELVSFVTAFNKVFISQKDPAAPKSFSSGSTGQYVGRTFVTNPHLQWISDVEFAEALIHEGIHSLLYMQERRDPWILDEAVSRPECVIVSPWSGNALSVRSYLQAAFVWYGLAHLWALALVRPAFDQLRAMQRLSVATRGFLGASLAGKLGDYKDGIDGSLISAIDKMQSVVIQTFEEDCGVLKV